MNMEKSIIGYKCRKCGTVNYPHRTLCKKCLHTEFDPVALPKTGKLLTFTRLHNLAADFEVADLLLGVVELENGNRILGQLNLRNPKIGMKVKGKIEVVRKSEYRKFEGIVFYEA